MLEKHNQNILTEILYCKDQSVDIKRRENNILSRRFLSTVSQEKTRVSEYDKQKNEQ